MVEKSQAASTEETKSAGKQPGFFTRLRLKIWGETKAEKKAKAEKEALELRRRRALARKLPKYNGKIRFSKNHLSNVF